MVLILFFAVNGRMKEFIKAKWDPIKGAARMLKNVGSFKK